MAGYKQKGLTPAQKEVKRFVEAAEGHVFRVLTVYDGFRAAAVVQAARKAGGPEPTLWRDSVAAMTMQSVRHDLQVAFDAFRMRPQVATNRRAVEDAEAALRGALARIDDRIMAVLHFTNGVHRLR